MGETTIVLVTPTLVQNCLHKKDNGCEILSFGISNFDGMENIEIKERRIIDILLKHLMNQRNEIAYLKNKAALNTPKSGVSELRDGAKGANHDNKDLSDGAKGAVYSDILISDGAKGAIHSNNDLSDGAKGAIHSDNDLSNGAKGANHSDNDLSNGAKGAIHSNQDLSDGAKGAVSVSYTHLTLPTKRIV